MDLPLETIVAVCDLLEFHDLFRARLVGPEWRDMIDLATRPLWRPRPCARKLIRRAVELDDLEFLDCLLWRTGELPLAWAVSEAVGADRPLILEKLSNRGLTNEMLLTLYHDGAAPAIDPLFTPEFRRERAEEIAHCAARFGNVEMFARVCPDYPLYGRCAGDAAAGGHISILQHIFDLGGSIGPEVMIVAAGAGQIGVLDWCWKNRQSGRVDIIDQECDDIVQQLPSRVSTQGRSSSILGGWWGTCPSRGSGLDRVANWFLDRGWPISCPMYAEYAIKSIGVGRISESPDGIDVDLLLIILHRAAAVTKDIGGIAKLAQWAPDWARYSAIHNIFLGSLENSDDAVYQWVVGEVGVPPSVGGGDVVAAAKLAITEGRLWALRECLGLFPQEAAELLAHAVAGPSVGAVKLILELAPASLVDFSCLCRERVSLREISKLQKIRRYVADFIGRKNINPGSSPVP
jgi:hypothetical protein